jgi:hypothetical protein
MDVKFEFPYCQLYLLRGQNALIWGEGYLGWSRIVWDEHSEPFHSCVSHTLNKPYLNDITI